MILILCRIGRDHSILKSTIGKAFFHLEKGVGFREGPSEVVFVCQVQLMLRMIGFFFLVGKRILLISEQKVKKI